MATTPDLPFLWGAQYYRAPTPDPSCWERDLRRMRELGFTDVKYWAQWRWSHREPERFVWDDLDRLMDLAQANGLRVTINTIFDVAPTWLYRRFPEAKQITADGRVIEPHAVGHRQIGGNPGPCYHHAGARAERQRFLEAAVAHLAPHPALTMWDVWNEPEQCFPSRSPQAGNFVCYCATCQVGFVAWLRRRYPSLDALNQRWGRCYSAWEEVEAPRVPDCLVDWVDWREFHLDGMTEEARWRLAVVERADPRRVRYLHVVPNTMQPFNAVSCVDDFALAPDCQVFAATMNGAPTMTLQTVSAGRGKVCYNVESHVDFGSTGFHQRLLGPGELRRDLLPQLGLGIKGYLFWQYRSERLGLESPAWGLVKTDGSDRPVTEAARRFGEAIAPRRERLMRAAPAAAPIAIWKSRRNELFHHAVHHGFGQLAEAVDGYVQELYWSSHDFRFVSERMLAAGELDGVRLLILPSPYWLDAGEAAALRRFVDGGGVLLSEAHLGAYDGASGRHSERVPGLGLADAWGLREVDTTSAFHLRAQQIEAFTGELPADVRKALDGSGTAGGQFFPIELAAGGSTWGSDRFAILDGDGITVEGRFAGLACAASKTIGRGAVYYLGTRWGQATRKDGGALRPLLTRILARAGIAANAQAAPGAVRVDLLRESGQPTFAVVVNRTGEQQRVRVDLPGRWRGVFDGDTVEPAAGFSARPETAELYEPA
jgi:beta-galactosidase